MNYPGKFLGIIKSLKLRTKLIISFVLLISIPTLIIGFGFYNLSSRIVSENTKENIFELVKKNTQIVDVKLSKVQDSAMMMVVDQDLYKIFEKVHNDNISELLKVNNNITKTLSKYFSMHEDVYSAFIVTSKFTYGSMSKMFIPEGAFFKTRLYSEAVDTKGKTLWEPTYDFTGMFNQEELRNTNFDYRFMYSAVKLMNISTVEGMNFYDVSSNAYVIKSLDKAVERPVLILNFKESMFRDLYGNSIPIKEAVYCVIDKEGNIISHPDTNKLGTKDKPIWLSEAIKNETGTTYVNINGEKTLVCYDTSKVTGWISAIVVPVNKTLSTLPTVKFYTIYLAIGLTILSMFVAFLITNWIANPLKRLLKGIKSLGEGNFPNRISVTTNDEIGVLVDNFNDMNEKIQKLIEENYEVKLMEKEAQIMALNLQLNPHFMSNTLNTINWMAMENNQNEISKMIMSLSTMLRYTMKNTTELVKFKDDLNWLRSYIFIMNNRYEDVFDVEYDFDERLYETLVPKLFMQPIVENAILHGFEAVEEGGHIKIFGYYENGKRLFWVEDNGKGMNNETLQEIMQSQRDSIGIRNIDRRVKLLYGEEFGVNIESKEGLGTKVYITMP